MKCSFFSDLCKSWEQTYSDWMNNTHHSLCNRTQLVSETPSTAPEWVLSVHSLYRPELHFYFMPTGGTPIRISTPMLSFCFHMRFYSNIKKKKKKTLWKLLKHFISTLLLTPKSITHGFNIVTVASFHADSFDHCEIYNKNYYPPKYHVFLFFSCSVCMVKHKSYVTCDCSRKKRKRTQGEGGWSVTLCRAPGAFTHIPCFTLASLWEREQKYGKKTPCYAVSKTIGSFLSTVPTRWVETLGLFVKTVWIQETQREQLLM